MWRFLMVSRHKQDVIIVDLSIMLVRAAYYAWVSLTYINFRTKLFDSNDFWVATISFKVYPELNDQ